MSIDVKRGLAAGAGVLMIAGAVGGVALAAASGPGQAPQATVATEYVVELAPETEVLAAAGSPDAVVVAAPQPAQANHYEEEEYGEQEHEEHDEDEYGEEEYEEHDDD